MLKNVWTSCGFASKWSFTSSKQVQSMSSFVHSISTHMPWSWSKNLMQIYKVGSANTLVAAFVQIRIYCLSSRVATSTSQTHTKDKFPVKWQLCCCSKPLLHTCNRSNVTAEQIIRNGWCCCVFRLSSNKIHFGKRWFKFRIVLPVTGSPCRRPILLRLKRMLIGSIWK